MSDTPSGNYISPSIAGLLLAAMLYAGAYFVNVERVYWGETNGGGVWYSPLPKYRFGGEVARTVFQPMCWLDEQMRSEYWESRKGRPAP